MTNLDAEFRKLLKTETRKQRKARTRGTMSVIAVLLAAAAFLATLIAGVAVLSAPIAWLLMICVGPLAGWGFLLCWVLAFFMICTGVWAKGKS